MREFLAFDFGAESGRAVVGSIGNSRLDIEEIHRFPNRQINIAGHLHWDIQYLFEELKRGLSLAVERGHSGIESIGIDAWGVDFGFVGRTGKLIGLPFSYRDHRTDGVMEQVFKKITREEIYSLTAIQFLQINTLYQLYSTAETDPELISACDKLLFMPDLFAFLLTDEKFSEYTIASTSQMLDVRRKTWSETILSKLALPIHIMAPVVFPGTIIGNVRRDVLNEVGISREISVVAVGCHDTASAVAAVPAAGTNWAYLSSGTWSLIGIESDCPIVAKETMGDFTNEGGVAGTIRFLKNVAGMWLLQECRKVWRQTGIDYSYDRLAELALESRTFASEIDPDDPSFLNPSDMPDAIRKYCEKTGQCLPSNNGEIVRCIFRSLASKYRYVIGKIECVTGNKIDKLHIVGGGSRNEILNQITADVCGIPVFAGPVEATAVGNIMVQAIAAGEIKSLSEGRNIVARSFPIVEYSPRHV
jgi:rhamnulokinase